MDIIIGDPLTPNGRVTAMDTEERRVVVAPDKGDRIVLVLGINKVEVEHVDGSWRIRHSNNVLVEKLPVEELVVPRDTDLRQV